MKPQIRRLMTALAFAAGAAMSGTALADGLHQGDIFPGLVAGRLVVLNEVPTAFATGYKIFEGDFGDFAGGPFKTDDPGFDHEDGAFAPFSQLWYRGLGALGFWNGSAWVTGPAGTSVAVEDALGSTTFFSAAGVAAPDGAIGQFNAAGNIHQHLDFELVPGATSPVGAYLITLQLASRTAAGLVPGPYLDSLPFHIVFNNGLAAGAFEASVIALAVPEPGTYAMLLAGLLVLGAVTRRRSGAAAR
jgi:hypothetical protein